MIRNEIDDRIRTFIICQFLDNDTAAMPADDVSLLETGVIASLDVLELIMFIEEEFGVSIADEDVVPENFQSVKDLSALVQSKAAPASA